MTLTKKNSQFGMQKVSDVVATILKEMIDFTKPGMSTKALDEYGGALLKKANAKSAPYATYDFPGHTCISVNEACAHGIPSALSILKEGDLINIDVSAELDGYWADNGCSFVLGKDKNNHQPLVDASKYILGQAIAAIKHDVLISDIGHLIETEAKKHGYKVIRNLAGHGVGNSLHEKPENILNCRDRYNKERFQANTTVAIETFISTHSDLAIELDDGWTLVGDKGGYIAQHEHTILITKDSPVILTKENGI